MFTVPVAAAVSDPIGRTRMQLIVWSGSTTSPAWCIVAVTVLVLVGMPETRSRSMRDDSMAEPA